MDDLQAFFQLLTKDNAYILQAFAIIFGALALDLFQRKLLARLQVGLEKTKNRWDDLVVRALRRPLTLIIWAAGLYMASKIIRAATHAVIFDAVESIRDVVVVYALTWFLVRVINFGEASYLETDREVDRTTVDAISKLLRISVMLTAILVTLQTMGFSISGVLAFGGIGGIAIGFAAKDLLANFFGGLMIYLDRPFAVGDWIRSPDREIEGTVERIGWRLTHIRTFDKRPLYVPNSVFANISVENPSRMTNRRIYEVIGIRYADAFKMERITEGVKEMLRTHPEIDAKRTLMVNFDKFAPSSLDFFIYTFTRTTDWVRFHEIKQDVLLQVLGVIEKEGAEVAFPTSTVHLGDEDLLKRFEMRRGEELADG
ncbi:MAG: mechanosensitive ion channel family protein [Nitrospinaceae bacterium]